MYADESDMLSNNGNESESGRAADTPGPADGATPPPWLPRHPSLFWGSAARFDEVALKVEAGTGALAVLGPPPFPKSGFPFSGFLATVYDHVSAQCQAGASV